jgi:hypothetical protein
MPTVGAEWNFLAGISKPEAESWTRMVLISFRTSILDIKNIWKLSQWPCCLYSSLTI